MNILVDGYYLDKPRGLGRYLQELLFALACHTENELKINVIIPDAVPDALLISPGKINYIKKRRVPFPVWEQLVIPTHAVARRYDLVHFPYNTMPVCVNIPGFRRIFNFKKVVTIHDLIYMNNVGATGYQKLGNLYRRICVSLISKTNTKVVTDSQHSAAELLRTFDMSATVIYIPVEKTCPISFDASDATTLLREKGNYLLHIGGISPHKNSALCIKSFLAAQLPGWRLIVLGMPSDSSLAQQHSVSTEIEFPGWVSDEKMRSLLAASKGVLFPSLMEGYGLPVVEAFAAGKPLLTSNIPPMSELAGDAAVLVDPTSIEELTAGIVSLVSDSTKNIDLVQRGHLRMIDITSVEMARRLVAVYLDEAK